MRTRLYGGVLAGALALVAAACVPPPPSPGPDPCMPEVLSEGEVEAPAVEYEDGELELFVAVVDDDHGHGHDHDHDHVELDPACAILQVKDEALTTVPADSAFDFLGTAGSPVWVLPQSEDPDLLYLGYSTEEVDSGEFIGDTLVLTMVDVDGPGQFAAYSTDSFGAPTVLFDSNATGPQTLVVDAGEHTHVNWAFGEEGDYTVTWRASGITTSGVAVASDDVEFFYTVGSD